MHHGRFSTNKIHGKHSILHTRLHPPSRERDSPSLMGRVWNPIIVAHLPPRVCMTYLHIPGSMRPLTKVGWQITILLYPLLYLVPVGGGTLNGHSVTHNSDRHGVAQESYVQGKNGLRDQEKSLQPAVTNSVSPTFSSTSPSSSTPEDSGSSGSGAGEVKRQIKRLFFKKKKKRKPKSRTSILEFSRGHSYAADERKLQALRKLFATPRPGARVEWLMKLRRHSADRKWSKKKYKYFLLQLWSRDSTYIAWRSSLKHGLSPLSIERRLLQVFAPRELPLFITKFPSTRRPQRKRMSDWCQELSDTVQMVNAWAASEETPVALSSSCLLRVVVLHNNHAAMERMLIHHPARNWEEVMHLATLADKEELVRERLEAKAPRGDSSPGPTVRRVNYNAKLFEQDYSDQASDAMDEMAQLYVQHMGEDPAYIPYIRSVTRASLGTQVSIPFAEVKDYRNVFCKERGFHEHTVCPWFSTRRTGCRPRRGKACAMQQGHVERSKMWCPIGGPREGKGKCPFGATCRYRHFGDEYNIWVLRKQNGQLTAIKYVLRDTRNPWSSHYKNPANTTKHKTSK